jgi:uncharacterized protein (TIRG00374 family)
MRKFTRILIHISVFALSAFFLVLVLQNVGYHKVGTVLRQCNWLLLPPAFLAMSGRFLSWNKKWQVLTRNDFPVRFWPLYTMLMAGTFTNTVVPGTRAGGGLVRAFFRSRSSGRPFTICYGGVLLDGAFNMAAFTLLALCSLPFATLSSSFTAPRTSGPTVLLAITVFLVLALLALLHRRHRMKTGIAPIVTFLHHLLPARRKERFATPADLQHWIVERFREFVTAFKSLPDQPGSFWFSALLALMVYGFLCLCSDLLFRSLGHPVGILPIVSAVTLSGALGAFFMTPGGIGVADATLIGVYLAFGIEPDVAVAVSILYRIMLYGHQLVIGFPCLAFLQWRYGRVRPERLNNNNKTGGGAVDPIPATSTSL